MQTSDSAKIKIAVSACLMGSKCNFNGKDLLSTFIKELEGEAWIQLVSFCPEDKVFGTPRPNLRIVGGDGFDVLDGRAKVINENSQDVSTQQIEGATHFLKFLKESEIQVAILMDGSPSCGSDVILNENNWPTGGFKRGVGVTAALLKRHGIKVLSSFDERTISCFLNSLHEDFSINQELKDLRDFPKFKSLFLES